MSSDRRQQTATAPATGLSCSFCECSVREQLLAMQAYPDSERSLPDGIPSDGGLTLCPSCAPDVIELVCSWTGHDHPEITDDHCIGDGYQDVTDSCSFCTNSLSGDGILGIELYRRVGEELPAYANYTLCGDCQTVFSEFLCNVSDAHGGQEG